MPQDIPLSHNIIRAVEKTIKKHGMIRPGDAVLLGISGGPDSTALMRVMADIAPRFNLTLGAAHLNHCLRGKDADQDARFAARQSEQMNLPHFSVKTDVQAHCRAHKLSLEDGARQVRYDFFFKVMAEKGFTKLALGHHADDNAELVLMNLLRGCGPDGLGGIPPVREDGVIRPLIHLSKADILSYLESLGADHVTDASNKDAQFTRNRIRMHLLPILEDRYNPNIAGVLNRLAALSRDDAAWIEEMAQDAFSACAVSETPGAIHFSNEKLADIHPAACKRVLRTALRRIKGDLKGIHFSHISAVERMVRGHPQRGALHLPKGLRVRRRGDVLSVMKTASAPADCGPFTYTLHGPGTLRIPEINAELNVTEMAVSDDHRRPCSEKNIAFFDRDALSFPMVIRSWKPGDRFTPLGMTGRQKLSDFFINNKIPRDQRRKRPLALSRGEIIWVGGLRMSNAGKITPSTVNVLKMELLLA